MPPSTCSPSSPRSNSDKFVSPLQGLDNVILTPHVGGSTEEAQERIGAEVARKFVDYSDNGSTTGAVNFPQVLLPPRSSGTRFIHVHRNEPGGLGRLNEVFAQRRINIAAQYCQTDSEIGYVVHGRREAASRTPRACWRTSAALPGTICARLCLSRSTSRTFLISTLASSIWMGKRPVESLAAATPSKAGDRKSQSVRALEIALQRGGGKVARPTPSATAAALALGGKSLSKA